jgi:outer membrane receptor for ferrienterochelin and colicin
MKKLTLLLLFLIITLFAISQKVTISGYVTDRETGERLISASVYEKNTMRVTTANNYGFYSLTSPVGAITIGASYIGYNTREISLNLQKDTVINLALGLSSKEINEITVIGNKVNKVEATQMSVIDVPIQKLQSIPVILGEADIMKVIQLLPGVKGGTEGTSGIYVRGGGPDQNLFLLDGVPVYNASHLLGFFSVFNPDAIKTVKLYKGGFPARFGGRLSSVVDISMKDGNMKKLKGEFSIGLISSKLSLEGPIIKDKTSFIISARRTYLDILAQPLIAYLNSTEGGEDTKAGAYFHDFNLKVNHIFSERSRLYFSGYLGKDKGYGGSTNSSNYTYDDQKINMRSAYMFGLGWGNTIASLRWNYLINKRLFSNTTVTYSNYNFAVDQDDKSENLISKTKSENYYRYYSGIKDIAAKVDFDYFPAPGHDVKFGTHFTNHHFTPGVTQIKEDEGSDINAVLDTTFGNRDIYANELSSYIEDDMALTSNLRMNAGLHLSVFNVQGVTYARLQPRLSLRYKVSDNWSLKAAYSRMAQHVHLLTTSGISLPTDLWLPVTKEFEPPISDQVAMGAVINLPKNLTFSIEGYYKNMKNLIEYKEGASFTGNATNWESKVEKGHGWSYGAELMLEKTVGKTTGWIAYTLSWSNRQFENLNFGRVFPAKYDSRHDISVAITHEFSKKIDIGLTWVYNTGNAVTLAVQEYPQGNIPGTRSGYLIGGSSSNFPPYSPSTSNLISFENKISDYNGRNNYRMPAYHRLDIGINFHKQKKHGVRTWSISAYNAYNRQNPFFLQWKKDDPFYNGSYFTGNQKTRLVQYSLFPIIPSISYSFKF